MSSHVYILAHAVQSRFKVGKANDILSRSRNFGWEQIDFLNSLGLQVETEKDAYNLERIIHRAFRRWRESAEVVVSDGCSMDGATEWFSSVCRPRLEQFLLHISDIIPHTIISGAPLKESLQRLTQPTEAALERARIKAERDARAQARAAIRKVAYEREVLSLEQSMHAIAPKFTAELARQLEAGAIAGICERYGSLELILARPELLDPKDMWGVCLTELRYGCKFMWGSLVSSTSVKQASQGTVASICITGSLLPTTKAEFVDDTLMEKVFAPQFELLRSMPRVASEEVATIFCGWNRSRKQEQASQAAADELIRRVAGSLAG